MLERAADPVPSEPGDEVVGEEPADVGGRGEWSLPARR